MRHSGCPPPRSGIGRREAAQVKVASSSPLLIRS
ncbi:hypothetical protein ACP4OV_017307 [Aristida adscensionis]